MIAVVVSSCNRCYYCLVAHGQQVRALSGDPAFGEQITLNYRAADLSDRQRNMLDSVWKLTEDPNSITQRERDDLSAVGFDQTAIWDIIETASFFNYTNRMAHGLEMQPNVEYQRHGPMSGKKLSTKMERIEDPFGKSMACRIGSGGCPSG